MQCSHFKIGFSIYDIPKFFLPRCFFFNTFFFIRLTNSYKKFIFIFIFY
jgi:hypothetical protein